jgi:2-oxoglutarate dehydrogenase E2 component (dihydrolipoamide succinyltransferase)
MPSNVEVPSLGESVTEAVLLQWLKKEGDHVDVDEPLCELESDKATVDLPSPTSGVLHQVKSAGETLHVGEVVAQIDEAKEAGGDGEPAEPRRADSARGGTSQPAQDAAGQASSATQRASGGNQLPAEITAKETWKIAQPEQEAPGAKKPSEGSPPPTAPPERKEEEEAETKPPPQVPPTESTAGPAGSATPPSTAAADRVRRVPMSKIRRSIAERLVRAQQTTAMLTTFNEIDMSAVQLLRERHQEKFKESYGVSLGLMSFFARAAVLALKQFPILNARLENDDILYHEHVHLGIAVSTERGLVVPVLHHVEAMSFAQIESHIKRAAAAARDGKLSIEDLSGGTFTITNGGVFGSLLSTPILHPPQTGILGLHTIQERPVAVNRQVEVRPMMYVALTYDHRLVDGKDAISFLVRLKQLLEDPMQMVLEI